MSEKIKNQEEKNGETCTEVIFSPDDSLIALGFNTGVIRILNIQSKKEVMMFKGHKDAISALLFSFDGKTLISGSVDKKIIIWDAFKGKNLKILRGHGATINTLALNDAESILASGSSDKRIRLWNTKKDWKKLKELKGHKDTITKICFIPRTELLASASWDHLIILWNTQTGKIYRELKGHFGPIYDMTVTQEGSLIASCSSDGIIKIWDQEEGYKDKQLTSIKEAFTSIAFQPNNNDILVTASTDKALKIWQVPTISILKIIEKQKEVVQKITFSKDSQRFITLSYDGTVQLWNMSKLFEEEVEEPTLLSRAKDAISGGKVVKFIENLFQTKKEDSIIDPEALKKKDELKEKMLEELPELISVMGEGEELHIKVLQKRYNCDQKFAEEMIVRLLREQKIAGTFNPFTGVFVVATKTPSDIIQVEDNSVEMVDLDQTCFFCGEPITPEAIYCPGCHEEIATCSVCKLSIDFDDEVGVCVYCGAKGHLSHMKEAIKVSGFCPVCRKEMNWDTELTVFKREPKK